MPEKQTSWDGGALGFSQQCGFPHFLEEGSDETSASLPGAAPQATLCWEDRAAAHANSVFRDSWRSPELEGTYSGALA